MIQNAVILSTGDEITTGKVVDTNANYLSDKLAEIGIDLVAVITVGDVPDRLEWAWRTAIEKGDVVISTGGIGPTADDLTTETIARVAGVKLRRDDAAVDHMKRLFASISRPMPENNLKQADFPEGATVIQNPLGTAPGFRMPVTIARPHRASDRAARRAARDETDDGKHSDTVDRGKSRHRPGLCGENFPDVRNERVCARRSGSGIDQTG